MQTLIPTCCTEPVRELTCAPASRGKGRNRVRSDRETVDPGGVPAHPAERQLYRNRQKQAYPESFPLAALKDLIEAQ